MRHLHADQLEEAIAILREGGVVVYPTETSYGIGCDATNVEAVMRVLAVKGRPQFKGMTVLLPSFAEASKYVQITPFVQLLAQRYWPGPLNIVLPPAPNSSITEQCASHGTFSVRISSHPVAQALVRGLGVPMVSTSANLSGSPECYSGDEALAVFADAALQPDAVLDVGRLPKVPPSTTIKVEREGARVLRQGGIVVY